jgi:hypothetical protein
MLTIKCLAVVLVVAMTGPAFAQGQGAARGPQATKQSPRAPRDTSTGNGAQSGSHYNLNIIGKDNCPGDDLKGTNRHVIDVLLNFDDGSQSGQPTATLDRRNKIFLIEGDFLVVDGNACDSDGATFQLPANPFTCPVTDPECLNTDPTFQEYLVFARALATPGGSARITTCATDPVTQELVCSSENVVLVRNSGRSRFRNVTRELTTLCLDTDGSGQCDTRVGIFEDSLQQFFWDYDNNGLRLAQLRFYPIAD